MVTMICCHFSEIKYLDNVMLHYQLDKGHVQKFGYIAQECSHFIMRHRNFDPARVIYETIIQKYK